MLFMLLLIVLRELLKESMLEKTDAELEVKLVMSCACFIRYITVVEVWVTTVGYPNVVYFLLK